MIIFRFTIAINIPITIFFNKYFSWYGGDSLNFVSFSVLGIFEPSSLKKFSKKSSLKQLVLNKICFKRKFGFFKKKNKLNHFNLFRLNMLRNLSLGKINKNKIFRHKSRYSKFFDFKFSLFRTLFKNRVILKDSMFMKKVKQSKTTKIFSKILKNNLIDFSKFIEFSVLNLLIKSKFCSSLSESFFFINNKFVFVNGARITNPFFQINVGDVVQITVSDRFFNFFKVDINKKLKILNTVKHIIWRNNRFKNNFYKQRYNRVPSWISDISFFYEDVPFYLDVDYSVLSFCLLSKKFKKIFLKKSMLKGLNLFMLRNYNWNYIV